VTIIGLKGGQGYPTNMNAGMNPGDSSRIPGKSDIKERRA